MERHDKCFSIFLVIFSLDIDEKEVSLLNINVIKRNKGCKIV